MRKINFACILFCFFVKFLLYTRCNGGILVKNKNLSKAGFAMDIRRVRVLI